MFDQFTDYRESKLKSSQKSNRPRHDLLSAQYRQINNDAFDEMMSKKFPNSNLTKEIMRSKIKTQQKKTRRDIKQDLYNDFPIKRIRKNGKLDSKTPNNGQGSQNMNTRHLVGKGKDEQAVFGDVLSCGALERVMKPFSPSPVTYT